MIESAGAGAPQTSALATRTDDIGEARDRDTVRPGGRVVGSREHVVQWYYGTSAVLLTATLIAQCLLTHHEGRSLVNTFSYFTIQSNVLVLVSFVVLAVHPSASGPAWRVLRLGSLCGITVTGLVYATLLAPYVHLTGWAMAYDYVFHYVMPAASVVGFLLVGPRLRLERRDMAFMTWPVLWLVYTMLRGALAHPDFTGFSATPSRYPYEFLDIERVPLVEVIGSIAFVSVLLVGVGVGYIAVSHRLYAPRR